MNQFTFALSMLLIVACGGRDVGTPPDPQDPSGPGTTSTTSAGGDSSSTGSGGGGVPSGSGGSVGVAPGDAGASGGRSSVDGGSVPDPACMSCGQTCPPDALGNRYCDPQHYCAHGIPMCAGPDVQGDGGVSCAPMDALGWTPGGGCNTVYGWAWDGGACQAIVGCECRGADCANLFQSGFDCALAFRGCL